MSTTANALLLPTPAGLVPLDLLPDASLLPTFQANDRSKPDTIQADYSPEFEAPGTARNHALLRHAAASQPTPGAAYTRLPCVLTSGGVELLPLGILLVKGYTEGRYQLQVLGGNRRFVEALVKPDGTDKMLSDLDFSRFNHLWTPTNILPRLTYDHWRGIGYGYELFDRGKPVDVQAVDPYTLYPSVSYRLVLQQLLADAGFTATDLLSEPLLAALNVPAPNPYEFPQPFRDARFLKAGYAYVPRYDLTQPQPGIYHNAPFALEKLTFGYVSRKPYHAPDAGTATYVGGRYTVDTLGLYDLAASITVEFGSEDVPGTGRVRCKFQLKVNGQVVYDGTGGYGNSEAESRSYGNHTFTPKLSRMLLGPGDYVELFWGGDAISSGGGLPPLYPRWWLGPFGAQTPLHYPDGSPNPDLVLANEVQFTVTMLAEFPPGGLVRLGDWLPAGMKQLDFFKSAMLLLGLTVQADPYRDHLHLTPGNRLLSPAHVAKAKDWTRKRDAYAPPGRLAERNLAFRFGSYGQVNTLAWEKDEHVTENYGNGTIAAADKVLPPAYTLATLPFAASETSPDVAGLLRIGNFDKELTATEYTSVEAKPRLVLRRPDGAVVGKLVLVPEYTDQQGVVHPAQLAGFTTTASYFTGVALSLELDGTVLGGYWQDLRAMLDESRYLVERYRLTPQDVAELDYSVPIWDGLLGDYFAVSQVGEYDARRPVEVTLCRLNAKFLPPPVVPAGQMSEWYEGEFYNLEWY